MCPELQAEGPPVTTVGLDLRARPRVGAPAIRAKDSGVRLGQLGLHRCQRPGVVGVGRQVHPLLRVGKQVEEAPDRAALHDSGADPGPGRVWDVGAGPAPALLMADEQFVRRGDKACSGPQFGHNMTSDRKPQPASDKPGHCTGDIHGVCRVA